MSRFIATILAVIFTASAASALEPSSPGAVIVMDGSLAGNPRAEMSIEAAGQLLSGDFDILPASSHERIWPDLARIESCEPSAATGLASGISDLISEGRRLFFEEMDSDRSLQALKSGVSLFFSSPCLRSASPGLKAEVCAAGVLLVRLHLLGGRPEAASTTVATIIARCSAAELAAEDVPPEVGDFVSSAVVDLAHGSPDSRGGLTVVCAGSCRDVMVDGREVLCADEACARATCSIPAGRHVVDAGNVSGPGWYSGEFQWGGDVAVLVIAPGTHASASGVVVADPGAGADKSVSSMLGTTVLKVAPASTGEGWELTASGRDDTPARVLARLRPEGDAVRFSAAESSGLVLEQKTPWPWPWVSGSLSAAFLGAAIVLNVFAELAREDAESGQNTMARYEGLKGGAIAGYVTAGAGVLATVLLAVLRPVPDQSVLIVPSPSGFTIRF